mmetsp:Transcript_16024/g.37350  ORF Transcript_16024/g.37350 Transcript_16024/m.37350 type:complete len:368 (-) Transcript_16024:675-1778(-)
MSKLATGRRDMVVEKVVVEQSREGHLLMHFVGGAASGFVADLLTHPMDTVRTRLWMQDSKKTCGYRYNNLWHGLFSMVRKEGSMSLWKGFGPVALLTAPAHGVYFGIYEVTKELIPRDGAYGHWNESSVHLTAGFIANMVGAVLWTPMDVIKQRQQASIGKGPYLGPVSAIAAVYREDGMRNGLMRGYWSGLATYGPFSAMYFVVYEKYKLSLKSYLQRDLHTGHFSVGGFIAGAIAAVVTAPIDLVKTRIQVSTEAESVKALVLRLVREEGIKGFSRGIGARVCWVAPGCAITIAMYEYFKEMFNPVHKTDLEWSGDGAAGGAQLAMPHVNTRRSPSCSLTVDDPPLATPDTADVAPRDSRASVLL